MNVSNVMPESVTFAWSWMTAIGAVGKVESVSNVAVPPPPATAPFTQLAGLLQLPPAVPTSTSQVPLVCAIANEGAAAPARTSERRARLLKAGVWAVTGFSKVCRTQQARARRGWESQSINSLSGSSERKDDAKPA